jgi:hypothetical protein
MLKTPHDLVRQSLTRLRGDSDFGRVLDWLREGQHELDRRNRSMIDGVQLRMGQGASLALSEIIEAAEGKNVVSAPKALAG